MITLERFEHELLELKTQFPADHVGPKGLTLDDDGNSCVYGQIVRNVTGLLNPNMESMHQACTMFLSTADRAVFGPLSRAIGMNNAGRPWHQIVDALVPGSAIRVSEAIGSSASSCDPGMPGGIRETDLPAPEERPNVEQDEPALVGV